MVDPKGVGGRLRRARRAKGCSAKELAGKLGITENYLWRIERGSENDPKQLSLEKLRKACRILGVTSDWMLGLSAGGGPVEQPAPRKRGRK